MAKIAVIGGGGFIGAWICEQLHLENLHEPVACIRRWGSAVRIARFGIEARRCELAEPESIREAISGCDYVVSAAMLPPAREKEQVANLLEACREVGISRFIYLSSIAVYGSGDGQFDEEHELKRTGLPYSNGKIATESEVLRFGSDVHVTLLRPSLVYGPFSKTWTVAVAKRLCAGRLGDLGPRGEGSCNLVYVTDLVDAILAAIDADQPSRGIYNIDGGYGVSWNRYFREFGRALDAPGNDVNWLMLAARTRLYSGVRTAGKFALSNFRDLLLSVQNSSNLGRNLLQSTERGVSLTPTQYELQSYERKCEFPIARAKERLNFAPRVSFEQGLDLSATWYRQQSLA